MNGWTAKLYDSQGNEVDIKPGHVAVIGSDGSFAQVEVSQYEAELVYKEIDEQDKRYQKAKDIVKEWGADANLRRLKSG